MRRMLVYLALAAVLGLSLAIGLVAAQWPHWCRLLGWCDGRGLL